MAALGIDAEAEAGQQRRERLDGEREAVPLVALWPAERQHDTAVVGGVRIGGRAAVLVEEPAEGDRQAACPRHVQLAGRDGAGRHVDEDRTWQVGREGDADAGWCPVSPRGPPNGATDFGLWPESHMRMPIRPAFAAISG